MLNYSLFLNLIQSIKVKDNKLYAALEEIAKSLLALPDIDYGKAYCSAFDSEGTKVKFNRAFKEVDAVTIIPLSKFAIFPTSMLFAEQNITYLNIFLHDLAGNRVSNDVYWVAYGSSRQ